MGWMFVVCLLKTPPRSVLVQLPLQADAETQTRELAIYLGGGLKGPLRKTECDGGGKKAIEGAPVNRQCLATGLSAPRAPQITTLTMLPNHFTVGWGHWKPYTYSFSCWLRLIPWEFKQPAPLLPYTTLSKPIGHQGRPSDIEAEQAPRGML